jgi:hypothetical protein
MLTARTVPVVLSIARQMEQRCPDAILLIFTNPITNMVDAVTRYTSIRSIGICPGVYNFMWDVDALFDTGVPVVSKFLNEGQVPPHKRLAVPHQERIADDFWTPRAVLQPRNVRHLIGITS